MATYVITLEGSERSPRPAGKLPSPTEWFSVTRNGAYARPVYARADYHWLPDLEGALTRDGMDADEAKRRARDLFRDLGAKETRRRAESGELRDVPADNRSIEPVVNEGLTMPRAKALARRAPHYADGHEFEPFEVDD